MGCPSEDPLSPKSEDKTHASPDEGAELIRAFLQIEDGGIRAAIIEFVKRLSQANSRTG